MLGRAAKTTLKSKTGRKFLWQASKAGTKANVKGASGIGKLGAQIARSETGRKLTRRAAKSGARAAGRFGKLGAKGTSTAAKTGIGAEVGRRFLKGAAKGSGKAAKRGASKGGSQRGGTSNLFRYAFFTVVGLVLGAILARLAKEGSDDSSSFTDTTGPDGVSPDSPAGQRGETWGSGSSVGTPGGTAGEGVGGGAAGGTYQQPEDDNRTGSGRAYSDPSGGPLIGESHQGSVEGVTEQQEEVEQRIRSRIGEDPRTAEMPRVNVEVNDGVAEIRGTAPSEEAKDAAGEIAAQAEGVREVRNLITADG